jgi:hypothetical protein
VEQASVEAAAVATLLADERKGSATEVPGRDESVVDRQHGCSGAEQQRGRATVREREAEEWSFGYCATLQLWSRSM